MSATLTIPLPESERIHELEIELSLANMMILKLQEQLRLERIRK